MTKTQPTPAASLETVTRLIAAEATRFELACLRTVRRMLDPDVTAGEADIAAGDLKDALAAVRTVSRDLGDDMKYMGG